MINIFRGPTAAPRRHRLRIAAGALTLVTALWGAPAASATVDPPPGSSNCGINRNSYVGYGLGKGNSSSIKLTNEVLMSACLRRTSSTVEVAVRWNTYGMLLYGTIQGFVYDCTTKKYTLVTHMNYPNHAHTNHGARTVKIAFKSSHKVKPVIIPNGAYSRKPMPITTGMAGYFDVADGSRHFGHCA